MRGDGHQLCMNESLPQEDRRRSLRNGQVNIKLKSGKVLRRGAPLRSGPRRQHKGLGLKELGIPIK